MNTKEFKCNICNKFYVSYKSLWNHNNKFHKNEASAFVVDNTINVVDNTINVVDIKHNVEDNNINVINKKIIKCEYCNKIFASRYTKSEHKRKACKFINNNNDDNDDNDTTKKIQKIENTILELKDLILKNTKNHPKTLNKINQVEFKPLNHNINIIKSDQLDQIELKSSDLYESSHFFNKLTTIKSNDDNNIIKSNDNKFIVDINNNFMTFNDKAIKFFYYNDQVYFKAKHVAKMLDYGNTKQAIQNNVYIDDKIKISKLLEGGLSHRPPSPIGSVLENEDPKTLYINESGFYSIICASKKEEAIKFKRWVTSEVLPSIRKTGSYNITDNYIEEDLDKYYNKDCVYIIHIKDNIYKYGNSSHLFKRLQTHKTYLNYKKIIKIYVMNNMNESKQLENKINKLVNTLNINITYYCANNNYQEIFETDNNNLQNIIKKIDDLSSNIINKNNSKIENNNLKMEKEKTKQMELNNINIQIKNENLKRQKNII